eukprot:5324633-Amphidinium_carterae.1
MSDTRVAASHAASGLSPRASPRLKNSDRHVCAIVEVSNRAQRDAGQSTSAKLISIYVLQLSKESDVVELSIRTCWSNLLRSTKLCRFQTESRILNSPLVDEVAGRWSDTSSSEGACLDLCWNS